MRISSKGEMAEALQGVPNSLGAPTSLKSTVSEALYPLLYPLRVPRAFKDAIRCLEQPLGGAVGVIDAIHRPVPSRNKPFSGSHFLG